MKLAWFYVFMSFKLGKKNALLFGYEKQNQHSSSIFWVLALSFFFYQLVLFFQMKFAQHDSNDKTSQPKRRWNNFHSHSCQLYKAAEGVQDSNALLTFW